MSTQEVSVTRFNCPSCGKQHYEFEYDSYEKCNFCGIDLNDYDWTEEENKGNLKYLDLIINMDVEGNVDYKFEEVEDLTE